MAPWPGDARQICNVCYVKHSPNRKNFPLDLYSGMPAQRRKAVLELFGSVEHFHDVELPAVVELSTHDARIVDRRMIDRCRRLLQQAVDKEHLATGFDRRLNNVPEPLEPARGHV